jgi:hypothetical protein
MTLCYCPSRHIIRLEPCDSVIKSIGMVFVPSVMRLGQLEVKLFLRTCLETVKGVWRTLFEHAKKIIADMHAVKFIYLAVRLAALRETFF